MDIDTRLDRERNAKLGISFQVHDVEPETPDLPKISMADSLKCCLRSGEDFVPEIVAVSDSEGRYLKLPSQNGLLSTVHLAFSCHLPLTLSPDVIWLAILQGFGRHIHAHAKLLEGRLARAGKHIITVEFGETEWHWPMVFERFAMGLEENIGPWVRNLQADFSTTGTIERAASHVALMDLFSPYVQYIMYCVCGIPSIRLQGEESDWIRLREKLALLRGYDADDWIEEIDDILARFVDASRGNIDRTWWQQIYKLTPRYGGEDIEGWLGAFFPYLRDEQGTFKRRRIQGEKFTTEIVPPGLSDVKVKLLTPRINDTLRVVSGFMGVENLGPEGVAPKIGWAVVRNHFMETFVERLDEHPGIKTRSRPVIPEDPPVANRLRPWDSFESLPVDLQLFYQATDGADLFGKGVIHPLKTLLNTMGIGLCWKHLGTWNDGSLLMASDAIVRLRWDGVKWEHQTLATSFSDFIARLTAANGNAYWEEENFVEPELLPEWREFKLRSPHAADLNRSLELLRRENQRLRSMKIMKHDLFQIRPVSSEKHDHLPMALRWLYCACDGVFQMDGFELWPASRIAAIPGTNSRWFAIGAAPGYGILFDGVVDRGVAVIDREQQRIRGIANSLGNFLSSAAKNPLGLYWEKAASPQVVEAERPNIIWPDEHLDLPTLSANWAPLI